MRLSHDKMVHLSHVIVQSLQAMEELIFQAPSNDVRNRLLAVLKNELVRDDHVEARVRYKISSQKRPIPEGSPEWDVLYRKYYEEELASSRKT